MKKTMILAGFAIVAFLLITNLTTLAQDDNPSAPVSDETIAPEPIQDSVPAPGRGLQMLKNRLGLTDEQFAAIEKIHSEGRTEIIELQAKIQIAQLEINDLMKVRGNDDEVIKKSQDLSALRNDMVALKLQHRLAQRAVFTDEQWEKLKKFQQYRNFDRLGRRDSRRFNNRQFGREYRYGRGSSGRRDFAPRHYRERRF